VANIYYTGEMTRREIAETYYRITTFTLDHISEPILLQDFLFVVRDPRDLGTTLFELVQKVQISVKENADSAGPSKALVVLSALHNVASKVSITVEIILYRFPHELSSEKACRGFDKMFSALKRLEQKGHPVIIWAKWNHLTDYEVYGRCKKTHHFTLGGHDLSFDIFKKRLRDEPW
jgi:hypothetical protein